MFLNREMGKGHGEAIHHDTQHTEQLFIYNFKVLLLLLYVCFACICQY